MKKTFGYIFAIIMALCACSLFGACFFTDDEKPQDVYYFVSYSQTSNGLITLSSSGDLISGSSVTITATPDEGYFLEYFVINEQKIFPDANVYTVENIQSDINVSASFKAIEYSYEATAGANGVAAITDGASEKTKLLTVTPNEHYKITTLTVNGEQIELTEEEQLSFRRELSAFGDITAHAEFEQIVYKVTLSDNSGAIKCDKTQFVYGETVTLTVIVPEDGEILNLSVNGEQMKDKLTDGKLVLDNYGCDIFVEAQINCERFLISVSAKAGDDGFEKISLSNVEAVKGGFVIVTITPVKGKMLKRVTVNGKEYAFVGNIIEINDINENIVIVVESADAVYAIVKNSVEGGVIDSSKDSFTYGERVELYHEEAEGYRFKRFLVNGNEVEPEGGKYYISGLAEDAVVDAEFELLTYSIAVMKSVGGSVEPSKTTFTVKDSVVVSIIPDAGYTIGKVMINGALVSVENGELVIKAGTVGNIGLSVEFVKNRYSLTINKTGRGTAAADKTTFTVDDTITVTFTSEKGFEVSLLTVNGTPAEIEGDKLVLSGISENITIDVIFDAIKYKVNLTATEGGKVLILPENGFTASDTVVIVPLPDDGYELESVTINGESKTLADGKITLSNQKADIDVVVRFAKLKYSVTLKGGTGGTITADKIVYEYGDSVTVTVQPNSGYKLVALIVNNRDCMSSLSGNKIVLSGYYTDLIVEAQFASDSSKTYSLTSELDEKVGTVNFASKTVVENGTAVLSVEMKAGYKLEKVTANGKTLTLTNGVYRIEKVNSDISVCVEYSLIRYSITVESGSNATITAPATYTVEDAAEITAVGKPGYAVTYILINGERVAAGNGKVSLAGKSGNLTVSAECELAEYTIMIAKSDKYNATASASKATMNDTVAITVTPADGFTVTAVIVNGKRTAFGGTTYSLTGIVENIVVEFDVRTVQYRIGISIYNNGTLTTACGNVTADRTSYGEGDVVTFTVTEVHGYYLSSVTINGVVYTDKVNNGKFTYSGKYDIVVVANFKADGMTISGTVTDLSTGKTIANAKVYISGVSNYTATTGLNGKYSVDVANGSYTVKAATDGYKYYEQKQVSGRNKEVTANIAVANSAFGDAGDKASDFTDVKEMQYDFASATESIMLDTQQNSGGTSMLYFNNIVSDRFVFTFTAENACDVSTNYEKEPGIGIIIYVGGNKINCQFVAKRARVIVNDNWSSVPQSGSFDYYDFNRVGERHSLAFVKEGDTVYFFAVDANGEYSLVFAYTNALLAGDCTFGLSISKQSACSVKMKFDDIAMSSSLDAVTAAAKKTVEIMQTAGGYLTLESYDEGCLVGKEYKLYAVPDYGKQVTAMTIDGEQVDFISDGAGGGYCFVTLTDKNVKASAVFGNYGTGKTEYSDGSGYGEQDYDNTLFYRNDLITDGADPGVMYVSEQEDPVNGGWFYMTVTSQTNYNKVFSGNNTYYEMAAYLCYRSKDLASWELAGAIDGYSLGVQRGEWISDCCWAPEMMRDSESGKYFLYFSARSKVGNGDNYSSSNAMAIDSSSTWDRLYIGIAMSDYPQGPYHLVNAEEFNKTQGISGKKTNANGETITGAVVPINFAKNVSAIKNRGYDFWPAIDVSPFIDTDGTMYLYFSQHVSSVSYGNLIWSMKMKDMITPDYSTMRLVSVPGYSGVTSEGKSESIYFNNGKTVYSSAYGFTRYSYDGTIYGRGVNEGVNVIQDEESGKYFLTYSPFGYGSRRYAIMQAVSDNPQGPFIKLDAGVANPVLGIYNRNDNIDYNMGTDISASIDYIAGTGHHCFVKAGDELFAVYHAFYNPVNNNNGNGSFLGRRIAADRVYFAYNDKVNSRVLVGNGPTDTLQAAPAVSTGYENIASDATITASNADENTVKYLSDKLFVVHNSYLYREFSANGDSVIKVEFPSVRSVRAVMLYNSARYEYALKRVREIKLFTADGKTISLSNIELNKNYVDTAHGTMHYGGAIIADFDAVSISGMEITVRVADKFRTNSSIIKISDLVILGKCDENKAADRAEYASSNGKANGEGIRIDGKPFDKIWSQTEPVKFTTRQVDFEMRSYLGKEGVYYLFTAYNDRVVHSDERGNTYKYNGLRRFYKNTGWILDLYAGDENYNSGKRVRVTADAYSFIIDGGKTANVAMYVDGTVNTVVRSFSIEVFVPYEQFGCTSASRSFAKVQYRTAETAAVSTATAFNVNTANSGITEF